MKTCNSCFSKFQGLGYKCLHCLTYSDLEERRKEEARAQEDNRAYQEKMIRQENLRHAQELIEQRRENARIAAQQERDEMNQKFANAKTAETNIRTEDAFDYGKNYLAIDYKRGNPLFLAPHMNAQRKLDFAYIPPYLLPHLNNAFHRGLVEASQKFQLQTSFENIEKQYYEFGKTLSLNFQAKAVAKFLDEDVFMPSEVVTDLGRTVDMNDGTLTVRYDCSSINDPKLRDAWKRGADAAHLEFNSHAKKEERLQKEKKSQKISKLQ